MSEAGVKTIPDQDGSLLTVLTADELFCHNILIRYILRGDCLLIVGQASDYKVPKHAQKDVLMALNIHNINHPETVGDLHDDTVMFKHSVMIDEDVSEDYVREHVVKMGTDDIRRSFVELEKEIKDNEGNYKEFTLRVLGRSGY